MCCYIKLMKNDMKIITTKLTGFQKLSNTKHEYYEHEIKNFMTYKIVLQKAKNGDQSRSCQLINS